VTIRLVLDSSALSGYVSDDTRALDIGELLVTVAESGDITGIPVLCLITAYQQATPAQRVALIDLAADDDSHTLMLPLLGPDVPAIADLALTIPVDRAQAAAAATKHGAVLGTYHRAGYPASAFTADNILDL
jgi:hypothetical protein